MPTKLDFNIGNVASDNDAVYTGAINDVASLARNVGERAMSMVMPSAITATENTLQLLRKPVKTTFSLPNWAKLLKTLPVVGSDVAMKAVRLPFATFNDALQYLVNNNLERGIDLTKASTTRLVGNLISNKGQSRFKILKGLGVGVEGFGDIVGSVIKAPTGVLAMGTSVLDDILAKGTTNTNTWVNNLRVSDDNFIPRKHYDGITNTSSIPEAANDNRTVDKIAA